jgi:hypothetical protein
MDLKLADVLKLAAWNRTGPLKLSAGIGNCAIGGTDW